MEISKKWKDRYLSTCHLIASWSKIEGLERSAVIAGEDGRFVSLGFNGFARGVKDVVDRIHDPEIRKSLTVKASENAIYFSNMNSFEKTVIYTYPDMPDIDELSRIAQYGIKHIVSAHTGYNEEGMIKTKDPLYLSILRESGITYDIVKDFEPQTLKPIQWANDPETMDKWDKRYIELSQLVSTWSKDPSTQVGAVIVRENKSIESVGFNGFPKGVKDTAERLEDRSIKYPLTIHAEENAMRFATNKDYTSSKIYVYPCQPCGPCLSKLAQNGLNDVITVREVDSEMEKRWEASFNLSKEIAKEVGVHIKSIDVYVPERAIKKNQEKNNDCSCNHGVGR